jgi:hypothetical protein
MTSGILTAFNDHFMEFISDIQRIFPDDYDILTAKNSLLAIRKANPKMIIKIWNNYIVGKYKKQIEDGDISFFINKDYAQDLVYANNSDKIIESIDRLRMPIKSMNSTEQAKTMKYIQNLTKLANIYEST